MESDYKDKVEQAASMKRQLEKVFSSLCCIYFTEIKRFVLGKFNFDIDMNAVSHQGEPNLEWPD